MGLFQNIVDFYDYNLPYYRYYIYRRYLFDELKTHNKEKKVFSVYENVDYENAIDLVKECIKNAAFIGVAPAAALATYNFQFIKKPFIYSSFKALGLLATFMATGLMYGTTVVSVANLRGKKNTELNHFIAGCVSTPIMVLYIKSFKEKPILYGVHLGLAFGLIFAIFKYNGLGKLTLEPDLAPSGFTNKKPIQHPPALTVDHWRPWSIKLD